MFVSEYKIRVRYAETDRMGYVYYGNYATYFEVARVEALRRLGVSYRQLEDSGILLPVLNYSVKFLKPVYYDEEIKIITAIPELPGARIHFKYNCTNEAGENTIVFINKEKNRPVACPEILYNTLKKHFS
jgi:acyl-CoA thioester hydrolase